MPFISQSNFLRDWTLFMKWQMGYRRQVNKIYVGFFVNLEHLKSHFSKRFINQSKRGNEPSSWVFCNRNWSYHQTEKIIIFCYLLRGQYMVEWKYRRCVHHQDPLLSNEIHALQKYTHLQLLHWWFFQSQLLPSVQPTRNRGNCEVKL